mgnify:FL=1
MCALFSLIFLWDNVVDRFDDTFITLIMSQVWILVLFAFGSAYDGNTTATIIAMIIFAIVLMLNPELVQNASRRKKTKDEDDPNA